MLPIESNKISEEIKQRRRDWIQVIDGLLKSCRPVTLLRLGDRELNYLVDSQSNPNGFDFRATPQDDFPSVSRACGALGLSANHRDELQQAYENADLVDLFAHPHQIQNAERLPEWEWQPKVGQVQITQPSEAGVILDWTISKFGDLIGINRILICGAEASLQEQLLEDSEYCSLFSDIWTNPSNAKFIQPPNDGRNLAEDLDALEKKLLEQIDFWQPRFVFLCLGGAAKILAERIRVKKKIAVIDWGSSLRALTYAGSGGHNQWRSAHYPFIRHVPLPIYMKAIHQAFPNRKQVFYLSKAMAQMAFDLHQQEKGTTVSSEVFAFGGIESNIEGRKRFKRKLQVF